MSERNIIVVGASAGGVEALSQVFKTLPGNLRAAVFVVLHISPTSRSYLPEILSRASSVAAHHAQEGEPIVHGRIYVAPPDRHLLVARNTVHLSRGPKENHHRPAIDPLFRSAAESHGRRVLGVILTGSLDDGTAGLRSVKEHGGMAIVQDPQEAASPSMPENARRYVEVDYCLPLAEIASLLVEWAFRPHAAKSKTRLRSRKTSYNALTIPRQCRQNMRAG